MILLQETFLKSKHESPRVEGYTWYRNDRPTTQRGGVAILIHETVNFTQQDNPEHLKEAEMVGGLINTTDGNIYVASLYLPPSRGRKREIGKIMRHKPHYLIAGDLNAHWSPWGHKKDNDTGAYLDYWINELNHNIHIPQESTRVHPKDREKDAVLDYALTHQMLTEVELQVLDLKNSDHKPLLIEPKELNLHTPPNTRITRDWEGIANEMAFQEWPESVEPTPEGITEAVEIFSLTTQAVMLNNSRVIKIPHHRKRLIPRAIRILQKEKKELLKKFHNTRNQNLKHSINQISRRISADIHMWEEEKKMEELEKLNDPDTRWKAIRQTSNKQTKITTLMSPDGTPAYTDKDKADLIAGSLADRFTEHEGGGGHVEADAFIPPDPSLDHEVPVILLADVVLATKASKKDTSPGHDGIPYKAIELLNPAGFKFLTNLFNAILKTQFYPEEWKRAVIVPLPKAGKDPHQPGNYRPISLTPCIAKIFEKCLLPHLNQMERQLKVIPDSQMGFRERHSTVHQLTRTAEYLIKKWNAKTTSIMVALDVEAAFDKVPHTYLLYKMHRDGYPPWVIAFLASYFKNRQFIVKINHTVSNTHNIQAGTPQGAILSPFLYNNFISDMPKPSQEDGIVSQYADDTAYTISCADPYRAVEILQQLLYELEEWCSTWKSRINADKSQVMLFYPLFSTKNRQPVTFNLQYDQVNIPRVEELKYLGVMFDPKLKWETHIKTQIAKCKQRSAIMFKTLFDRSRLTEETRKTLYTALIRPVLTYGAPAWLGAAQAHKRELLRCEKAWFRTIFKIPRYVKAANIYQVVQNAGMPHLQAFLQNQATTFLAKCQQHTNPLINSLFNYEIDFNRIGRRANLYKRNLPLQVPVDNTLP